MKITTENTLTKLIELTKNNIESKPSIDDTASSTDKVYSSSKVDELILNKIVTIALKIGYAEWQQDVYNNYYVEKDLTDQLAQYSFSSSNFSMMVDIDESSAVSPIWSNIKVSRVGNILRFESPTAMEYTITVFVEVWENKLEGEQPLYAFKKNIEDLSGVSGGAIYKEISILFSSNWTAEDDHFKFTHLLTTEDWTNKICFVDGIYGNNPQTGEVSYRDKISQMYKGQLVHDENGTSLVLYSYEQIADLHLKVTLFDKANDIQTLAPPSNETVLESNSVYINNSNNIDDISNSDYTTYSSSKIESLLENVGGGNTSIKRSYTIVDDFRTKEVLESYIQELLGVSYQTEYNYGTILAIDDDLSGKNVIISLSRDENYNSSLAFGKILKGAFIKSVSRNALVLEADVLISDNLNIDILAIDNENEETNFIIIGGTKTDTNQTIIAPWYVEYETPLYLTETDFEDNTGNDDLPYKAQLNITDVPSDYGDSMIAQAFINPTVDNTEVSKLKYTEVIPEQGNALVKVYLYFKEKPISYGIQGVNISYSNKIII